MKVNGLYSDKVASYLRCTSLVNTHFSDELNRIRKTLENKTNMEDDRISFLESQLAQARQIAEESDKKYEEVRLLLRKDAAMILWTQLPYYLSATMFRMCHLWGMDNGKMHVACQCQVVDIGSAIEINYYRVPYICQIIWFNKSSYIIFWIFLWHFYWSLYNVRCIFRHVLQFELCLFIYFI